ncbi:hypothetical protein QYE76_027783 [Lolium multiflorum]|uniref:Transposase-associated domain-containing protein n=1 Tax=Lolium multiflorum TaxID=4521 RepID=A0AAD8QJR1_LOLMU|nr:hypothetical protein QYE76_027783 [Lolium multiflorum]
MVVLSGEFIVQEGEVQKGEGALLGIEDGVDGASREVTVLPSTRRCDVEILLSRKAKVMPSSKKTKLLPGGEGALPVVEGALSVVEGARPGRRWCYRMASGAVAMQEAGINHPWMYDNRCDPAFREGVKSFLLVAEANKSKQGFICCPCLKYRNEKYYSCSRDIQSHLLPHGFMSGYNVWTKHGEEGVMMEDDDEEDNDDNYRFMFLEYDDTAMEDKEEEGGEEWAPDEPGDDDLRPAISDGRRDCGTYKERLQFNNMLEDHQKLLYPGCEDGQKKLGSILQLLKWKAEAGVTDSGFEKLLIILKKRQERTNCLPSLPDKFAEFIAGNEPAALHLREAGCDCCRWPVDVLFDRRGKMYFHTGWE